MALTKPESEAGIPPARLLLGRRTSFWRTAAAAGLGAAAVGGIPGARLSVGIQDIFPLLLMGCALFVAGPPRKTENYSKRDFVFAGVAVAGFAIPIVSYFLGLTNEPGAVLQGLPLWLLLFAAFVLNIRLRQHDSDLPALFLVCAGLFRILFNHQDASFREGELIWWLVTFCWCGAVFLNSMRRTRDETSSSPLVAGIGWFVLGLAGLTITEWRFPFLAFADADRIAAMELLARNLWLGSGIGSFDSVMLEHALRNPGHAAFTSKGYLRFASDAGVPAITLLACGFLGLLVPRLLSRPWDRGRYIAVGAFGFWVLALASSRDAYVPVLAIVFTTAAGALGQSHIDAAPEKNILPAYSWDGWITALAGVLIPAALFTTADLEFRRDLKSNPLEADSFLSDWPVPYRERAWQIRQRSEEIAQYSDPRRMLEPVAARWVEVAPHDELANLERIRWASRALDPAKAEAVALDAHRRLPWSPAIAAWAVRIMHEQGKTSDAVGFLETLAEKHGGLHPALQSRLVQMKKELAE